MKFLLNTESRLCGYPLAVLIVFIWSITFVATKYLLGFLSPCEILLCRVIIAYIAFVAAEPKFIKPTSIKCEIMTALIGLSGITFYFLLENGAMVYSTASNVAMICGSAPLITGLISQLFTKDEHLSIKFIAGTVCCFAGLGLIILNGRFVLKLNPIGDLMALAAAISFSVYSVVVRDAKTGYSSVHLARKMLFYALVSLVLCACTPFVELHPQNLTNPSVIGNLLFLGLCASALCTWGWNVVIWKIGAVKANNLIYLSPPLTAIFSAVVLHERITVFAAAGCLLIMAGVAVSQMRR